MTRSVQTLRRTDNGYPFVVVRLIDVELAERHLCAADPVMARLVTEHGPFAIREPVENPFMALCRAIVYQQLSGKAAGTIFGRFAAVLGERPNFLDPAEVLTLTDEQFRAAGMSRQKTAALRSLAEHFAVGDLSRHVFEEMDDEDVIARLTQVRGIGRWSAEMFLLFQLRRADVLPVNDLGINRAIMKQYRLPAMPKPDEVRRIGELWRPWASVACWYLWRSEDVRLPAE
jgi:DNA-3-methyladenine glycosylase II